MKNPFDLSDLCLSPQGRGEQDGEGYKEIFDVLLLPCGLVGRFGGEVNQKELRIYY
jgi:hypothetical protein